MNGEPRPAHRVAGATGPSRGRRNTTLRALAILGVAGTLAVNAWGGERRKLTAEELKEDYSRVFVLAGVNQTYKNPFLLVSRPDGTRVLAYYDGQKLGNATGTYRLDGDKLCAAW